MIVAAVIMAVFVIVCMAIAIKINNSGEAKAAVVVMCAGLVMLVCTVSFVLSPSGKSYIKTSLFAENAFSISGSETDFLLPLPDGSVKENSQGDNVFSSSATANQIEKFYSNLVGEENCVVIKTGEAERISFKYKEMYFLVKVTEINSSKRQLEITITE